MTSDLADIGLFFGEGHGFKIAEYGYAPAIVPVIITEQYQLYS
jgi:hypothetical protein